MKGRLISATLLVAAALVPVAARADDEEARAIVQLSYVATVAKCMQAGLEFSQADLEGLSNAVRVDADRRNLSDSDRNRLWSMGQMMSSGAIDAEGCGKARGELATWFPAEALQ